MTSQTPEELDDQLLEALTVHLPNDDAEEAMTTIAPALAAIRRHAAATALRGQAKIIGQQSMNFAKRAGGRKAGTRLYDVDMAYSQQARVDARRLRTAADDVIAEGWEHACAVPMWPATREDPAEGCETRVENEGDYCPKHEPADDYDPRDDR